MRPVLKIQARRSSLDAAQQQMPHRVEADGVQAQGIFDGRSYFFQCKGLKQSQNLDVLSAGVLVQPGFEQSSQLDKTLGQLPAGERRGLIERPALVFEQGQAVQRIVDRGPARIAMVAQLMALLSTGSQRPQPGVSMAF